MIAEVPKPETETPISDLVPRIRAQIDQIIENHVPWATINKRDRPKNQRNGR